MIKTHKNSTGFGTTYALILVLLIILGLIGYSTWHRHHTASLVSDTARYQSLKPTTTAVMDRTNRYQGWKSYASSTGFSIKYPTDWSTTSTTKPTNATDAAVFGPAGHTSLVSVTSFNSDKTVTDFAKTTTGAVQASNTDTVNSYATYYQEVNDGSSVTASYTIAHKGKIVVISMLIRSTTPSVIDNSGYSEQFNVLARSTTF